MNTISKAGIAALICGVIFITGCASLQKASPTIGILLTPTNMPTTTLTKAPATKLTPAPTPDQALQVDSFASLKAACEGKDSITIKLTKDITATDDLKILSMDHKKREVTLDLNGHTLFFENEKNMDVYGEDTKSQITFTLTSGQKGSSLIFLFKPEGGEAGGISNSGTFILNGDVTLSAMDSVTMRTSTEQGIGTYLISTDDTEGSLFIMNSGTLDALGNYMCAIDCSGGQAIINGGVINNEGNESVAVDNWGGKIRMNGGEIHVSGDNCIAIKNEDTYDPLGNDNMSPGVTPEIKIVPDRDTFVMTGGVVSAEGKDSIAVTLEKNCTVSGGTISAVGGNSIGISYYYVGGLNKEEKLNINLTGGQITGGSHALTDHRGNKAFYKNAKGEKVTVDSSVKEIKLG